MGGSTGLVGIIEDITELRKAQETLAESEERYRTFVEQSNLAIFISGIDGCLIHANPRMAQQAGYEDVEDLMGCTGGAI